jgi:predicted transcriptional regulator
MLSGGRLAEAYAHTHGRKVGEIMTARVVTIDEDADLSQAVDLMLKRGVKRLPRLRGDAVVGVISRSDLLKCLLASLRQPDVGHPDEEIKAAIQAELDELGWAPRASVRVEVKSGAITFDGAITDERLRSGLRVIAENIPGVTAVHDRMCWIEPNSGFYVPTEEDARGGPNPG